MYSRKRVIEIILFATVRHFLLVVELDLGNQQSSKTLRIDVQTFFFVTLNLHRQFHIRSVASAGSSRFGRRRGWWRWWCARNLIKLRVCFAVQLAWFRIAEAVPRNVEPVPRIVALILWSRLEVSGRLFDVACGASAT